MRAAVVGVLYPGHDVLAQDGAAQRPPSGSHAVYMTAVEFNGSPTADRLAVPQVDRR
jgi:hypothetical protein